jgi:hypothetical protein
MELEHPATEFDLPDDRRAKIPEPPPVQLVAVADVSLPAVAGIEKELDVFYVELLKFERDVAEQEIVYRSENFRLRIDVHEVPPDRDEMRPIGIAIPSLAEMMQSLTDRDIEFVLQRGISAAQETLLLRDPAGNWVELSEMTRVG